MRLPSSSLPLAAVLALAGCEANEPEVGAPDADGKECAAGLVMSDCMCVEAKECACGIGESCDHGLCTPDCEWANWPVPTFVDSNYSTTPNAVTDWTTGLMWQRNVPSSGYTWADAKGYCAGLELGGLSG